jgi:hypothetical protein
VLIDELQEKYPREKMINLIDRGTTIKQLCKMMHCSKTTAKPRLVGGNSMDKQTWQGIKHLARQGNYQAITEQYTLKQVQDALNHACMVWNVAGGTAPLWAYRIKTARDVMLAGPGGCQIF